MADTTQSDVVFRPKPSLPPPPNTVGAVGWLRKNLFGGPVDTILTLIGAWLIFTLFYSFYEYGIANAVWTANSYRECLDTVLPNGEKVGHSGACWAGVGVWMNQYIYGRYPDVEQWRVQLSLALLVLWLLPFWLAKVDAKIQVGLSCVLTFPFLAANLLLGGESGAFLSLTSGFALALFVMVALHVISTYAVGRSIFSTLAEAMEALDVPIRVGLLSVVGLATAWVASSNWGFGTNLYELVLQVPEVDASSVTSGEKDVIRALVNPLLALSQPDYVIWNMGFFDMFAGDRWWALAGLALIACAVAPIWFVTQGVVRIVALIAMIAINIGTLGLALEGGTPSTVGHLFLTLSLFGFVAAWGQFLTRMNGGSGWPSLAGRLTLPLAIFIGAMLYQSSWSLEPVKTTDWGGLFLTLSISGIAIASALPSGVVLALGRRSKMPVIRVFCTLWIEMFRSVPLITILFMAVTMMPLFLPVELNPDKLVMVIVAVCIFASAYMAEIVRGGLQAIPKGQYEAAQALGLNYWKMMTFIVMPQALKLMIPNIVGNFIGLLKDTTLVSIIGLYDILLMVKASGQDPNWLGLHSEPLLFAAGVFFVICFAMSKYSQHLERTIAGGYGRR